MRFVARGAARWGCSLAVPSPVHFRHAAANRRVQHHWQPVQEASMVGNIVAIVLLGLLLVVWVSRSWSSWWWEGPFWRSSRTVAVAVLRAAIDGSSWRGSAAVTGDAVGAAATLTASPSSSTRSLPRPSRSPDLQSTARVRSGATPWVTPSVPMLPLRGCAEGCGGGWPRSPRSARDRLAEVDRAGEPDRLVGKNSPVEVEDPQDRLGGLEVGHHLPGMLAPLRGPAGQACP